MRLGIFFSGGKDSVFTIFKALSEDHEVKYLLTFKPQNPESYMFHTVSLEITKIQAKLMKIKHYIFEVSGEKEIEIEETINHIKKFTKKIDAIGAGVINSMYQYHKLKKIAETLDLKLYTPILNINCKEYWNMLLRLGFKIIITKVSADGLSEDLIGKVLDFELLKLIYEKSETYKFNLCFEGGEAETLVLDSPLFSKEIEIERYEIKKDFNSAWIEIKSLKLKEKKSKKIL